MLQLEFLHVQFSGPVPGFGHRWQNLGGREGTGGRIWEVENAQVPHFVSRESPNLYVVFLE